MKKQIIFLIIALLLPAASLHAALTATSVTLTPALPRTLSNGNSYYLAGHQPATDGYRFRVQVSDPAATNQAYWGTGNILLTITGPITFTIPISSIAIGGTGVFTAGTDSSTATVTLDSSSSWSNLNYQIDITFAWNMAETAAGPNSVTATVNETTTPSNDSDIKTFSFGVCSSIWVASFAQNTGATTVAADGYVNPWHSSFNVTGVVVYNVTGATVSDKINAIDPGELSLSTLYTDGLTTYRGAGWRTIADDDLSFTVPSFIAVPTALGVGNHSWTVVASMTTGGASETSQNSLGLICDRVQIDTITFVNGGGVTTPPTFYRSVNVPGTQITIGASRQFGGALMIGTTTITVSDGTNTFPVVIADSAGSGTGTVTIPALAQTPTGQTTSISYQVIAISGSVFDSEQNVAGRVTQPASPAILWDRNDPPGDNNAPGVGETRFTGFVSVNPIGATSFTLNWTPLVSVAPDEDFFTYRVYYKLSTASIWTIVDTGTIGYANLGLIGTPSATITGLVPLTRYDYFITAVDLFGQEVEHPVSSTSPPLAASPSISTSDACFSGAPNTYGFATIQTSPTTIEALITDGITNYTYAQFAASINASTRPLRKSSLRVTTYIVSAGDQPDNVNIILAQDDGSGTTGTNLVNVSGTAVNGTEGINYSRISCSKSGPNTWQGYIPSNNQFLIEGLYCRLVIESIRNSTPTYSDIDSTTDGDPNNFEYTFMVQTPTVFTPWPTRILNNVLTDEHPVCYPAYYLSDDAYVTITAHDVKGRPVATLIDNGFRKGGQNIKEGGWSGENKARKKLGVGLYFIRFEAKRARDGRIILNSTQKLVVAK
ncbi:MAG: fibronectin type III domain-containing protein [Spirochaetota bacterium]